MLHTLSPAKGARQKRKRVGRGLGSGHGMTGGRGTKGQQSRAGSRRKHAFEGGQSPLLRRQPKLGGFKNPRRVSYEVVNLSDISKLPAGSYDAAGLKARRLVRSNRPVKLLGEGEIAGKYVLKVSAASKPAKEAVEKAGGAIEFVSRI